MSTIWNWSGAKWSCGRCGDTMRSLEVHHQIRPDLMHFYSVRRADHGSAIGTSWPCFLGPALMSKVDIGHEYRFSMCFEEFSNVFKAGKWCQMVFFEE